jgi:hypothetical protein
MRYGKRFAQRPVERETLFLVTAILFAIVTIGAVVGRLWIG